MTWKREEVEILVSHYPDLSAKQIAAKLNKTVRAIYDKANLMNLKKSEQFLKSVSSGRIQRLSELGKLHQFQKGLIPWTKGKKQEDIFTPDQLERVKSTQFKPGIIPHNYKPVGSTRINVDGYYEIKIREGKHNWELLHRVVWEAQNGPIPPKMNVMFADGNKLNTEPSNLVLRTKKECMLQNTIRRYPEELQKSIHMIKKLERRINKSNPNSVQTGFKPVSE